MTWQPPDRDARPGDPEEDEPSIVLCGYRPMLPSLLILTAMVIVVWELDGWKMLGGLFVSLWAGGMFSTWMFKQHIKQEHQGQLVRRVSGRALRG